MSSDRDHRQVNRFWPSVFREHTVLWKLDVAILIVQALAALAVGFFVVGRWFVQLWQAQAWWQLALLSGVSIFLLLGFARELYARRLGSYGLVVLCAAVWAGAVHLLNRQG